MKVCNRCGVEKPTTEFYASKRTKSGIANVCKECENSRRKRLIAQKTPERIRSARILHVPDKERTVVRPPVTPVEVTGKKKKKVKAPETDVELLQEAQRLAIMKLITRHRSEFDAFVYRAQVSLKYFPEKKVSA